MVPEKLLEILVCPKCKGDLEYKENFKCYKCRLIYNVIDNEIPNMLIDEAERF